MAESFGGILHSTLNAVTLAFALIGLVINLISIVYKFIGAFTIPKVWKYTLLLLDISHVFIGFGLSFYFVYNRTIYADLCKAFGFLLLFGIYDVVCGLLTSGVTLLCVQNPGSSTSLSKLHKTILILTVTPQKVVIFILCLLTVFNSPIFDADSQYSITCVPVRRADETGAALSILIFCLLWFVVCLTVTFSIINLLKFRKANRVFSSSSNIWQSQISGQGKLLQKLLIVDELFIIIVIVFVTYYGFQFMEDSATPTWVTMVSLGVTTVIHGIVSNFGNIMWNSCCCRANQKVEEPHRKLKKLELIKIEVC